MEDQKGARGGRGLKRAEGLVAQQSPFASFSFVDRPHIGSTPLAHRVAALEQQRLDALPEVLSTLVRLEFDVVETQSLRRQHNGDGQRQLRRFHECSLQLRLVGLEQEGEAAGVRRVEVLRGQALGLQLGAPLLMSLLERGRERLRCAQGATQVACEERNERALRDRRRALASEQPLNLLRTSRIAQPVQLLLQPPQRRTRAHLSGTTGRVLGE